MPLGKCYLPALPASGMDKLKKVLLDRFSRYRRNLAEFEELWEECILSRQHLCKRLRRKKAFSFIYLMYFKLKQLYYISDPLDLITQVYVACKHRLQHNHYIFI